jgi:hypothetical protein
MRSLKATVAFALVPLVAAACGGRAVSAHPAGAAAAVRPTSTRAAGTSRPAVTSSLARRCPARALILRPGPQVSPMTGEHAVLYALRNRGSVSCTLDGYPQVVLYDAKGAALPLHYTKGGGEYVTSKKPATVIVAPGASAYVLIAKYRCDIGDVAGAAALRLTVPATDGVPFVGRDAAATSGVGALAYCLGGPHDLGQTVAVSPFEPTPRATSSVP